MTTIINVEAEKITPSKIDGGTVGSYGFHKLSFRFSAEWKGLGKRIVFYIPRSAPVALAITDDTAEYDIPAEVKAYAGEIPFTIEGYFENTAIYTVSGVVMVTSSAAKPTRHPPTPSEVQQIYTYLSQAQRLYEFAFNPRGEYSTNENYKYLDVITYNNDIYIVKKFVKGVEPADGEYYMLAMKHGESAYEVAVRLGFFEGTEEDWNNALEKMLLDEQARVAAEAGRVAAENKRVSDEEARKQDYAAFKTSVDSRVDSMGRLQVSSEEPTDEAVDLWLNSEDEEEFAVLEASDIVQSLGEDPKKVMSQKATTDAFKRNVYDVISVSGKDTTYNGITFVWNGNTCEVSGTSTDTAFSNCFGGTSIIPKGIEKGHTYYFDIRNKTEWVSFRYYFYYEDGSYDSFTIDESCYVTIPANLRGFIGRINIPINRTVNGIITVSLLNEKPIENIVDDVNNLDESYEILSGDVANIQENYEKIISKMSVAKVTKDIAANIGDVTLSYVAPNRIKIYGLANSNSRVLFLNGQNSKKYTDSAFDKTLGKGTYQVNTVWSGYGQETLTDNARTLKATYTTFVNEFSIGNVFTLTEDAMIGLFIGSGWDYGTEENPTYLDVVIEKTTSVDYTTRFLESTNDTTDRKRDIETELYVKGICCLGVGDFYVSDIVMPANSTLIGCGSGTRIFLKSDISEGYTVKLNTNCTIKNLSIHGATENITISSTIGTRHAIGWIGNEPKFDVSCIDNVVIKNFSGSGIYGCDTGSAVDKGLNVTNVYITRCNAGIYLARSCEFNRFTNCIINDCYYAIVNNTGNNTFINCNLSSNRYGYYSNNSTGEYSNTSCNDVIGCHIDHMHSNGSVGIYINNMGSVQFTNCQIWYANVKLINVWGVNFNSCSFGREFVFNVENTKVGVVMLSNSIFREIPTFTLSGEKLVVSNCFTHSGEAVTKS